MTNPPPYDSAPTFNATQHSEPSVPSVRDWKARTGEDVQIQSSHGGSGAQARAVDEKNEAALPGQGREGLQLGQGVDGADLGGVGQVQQPGPGHVGKVGVGGQRVFDVGGSELAVHRGHGDQLVPGGLDGTGLAVRTAIGPLTRLVKAVEHLDPNRPAQPLAETGPREVAHAAAAFNAMQARLRGLFAERTPPIPVVQFTATPFREDGRRVDGEFIYTYPLKKAQEEGYFKPIRFEAVFGLDRPDADLAIASQLVNLRHAGENLDEQR